MAMLLLVQSVMPASIFANAGATTTAVSYDTRLATIQIAEDYSALMKTQNPSLWQTIQLAARLYAVTIVGPSCEQQASAANTSRLLDSQTKTTAPVYQWLSLNSEYTKTNTNTAVSPLCNEIFANKGTSPSDDLLRLYEKFFAVFLPTIDFNTFVQEATASADPEVYIQDTLSSQQIQKIQEYLTTKQVPTQTCSLTSEDEALYMQAKAQYIAATDRGEAANAKLAFDTMNQIQSRVVCSEWVTQWATPAPTLNPDCTNKVSILKSQIASLQSDPALYQQDITRIQKSIDMIAQSPDCSITTKRTQLPVVSGLGSTPRLTTDILKFQAIAPTQIPDTTPLFCQSTASALGEQLDTASYYTVNKLIDTIDAIKSDLTPQKQSLATLVQTLAVDKAAIKAQNLWLTNPSSAAHRFVSILEMIANNILTNAAMYKLADLFPLMNMYWNAIDQTSLWMADTFTSLQRILDAGARFVRNEGNQSFVEEAASNPWITFLARSNESAQSNDLSVVIKELSAFQFKEWVQEVAYSSVVTPSVPTIEHLTTLYFGSQTGEPTPYDNTRNNRVWYDVTPSATTSISDAEYSLLSKNKRYYNYLPAWRFPIEVYDVNGMHIAVIPDHDMRTVSLVPAGVYSNDWLVIEVGADGQAAILHEHENTYPQAIDVAGSIDGKLQIAVKGNITWPEELAPFIPEDPMVAQAALSKGLSLSAESKVEDRSYTVTRNTKQRQDMIPEKVVGEIFFSPNVLRFELNRVYNPTNGTNTITLQATLVGGNTCGVQINGSVTYMSDEYGIWNGGWNPVTYAQFDIGTESYKFDISSSYIDDIVQGINAAMGKGEESDPVALINEKVVNSLSVLGNSFGTLVATQGGVNIRYADQQEEDFVAIIMPAIERLDLWRLGQFINFASDGDGGWKTPVDQSNPTQDPAYVNSASSDQNTFTISFSNKMWMVYPSTWPTLYVDVCTDKCQTYRYAMDLVSGWDYSYTIPLEVYEMASSIYMQADHNGNGINYQFM